MKKFVSLLAVLFLISASNLYPKGFFYEIVGKNSKVYLLGSIHLAKQDAFPLDSVIENAFASCGNLVLEVNLNNINPMEIFQYGVFQDTTKLEDVVPPKYFKIMDSLFTLYAFPKMMYNKFKPWVAVLILQSLEMTKASEDFISGVETYFINKLDSSQKVLELESFKEQLDVFQSLYSLDSERFFEYFLTNKNNDKTQFDKLYEAWLKGDEKSETELIEKELEGFELAKQYRELLLESRNRRMANDVENFLMQEGCYFVVVGAGHLIGSNGIVNLLRQKGYEAKRVR